MLNISRLRPLSIVSRTWVSTVWSMKTTETDQSGCWISFYQGTAIIQWTSVLAPAPQSLTDNLITMLRLPEYTVFSFAVHRPSDIIKTLEQLLKLLDTRLLEELCDVNTEGIHDVKQKYSKQLWRKKSRLTRSIVIRLPVISFQLILFCWYHTFSTNQFKYLPQQSKSTKLR